MSDLFKGVYRIPSNRLKGWDYSSPGCYFVTICTHGSEPFFGAVFGSQIHLSSLGETAARFWLDIPQHHSRAAVDAFVVMPNHVHGIVVINDNDPPDDPVVGVPDGGFVETQHAASLQNQNQNPMYTPPGSLGAIIRSYKSAVTRWAHLNGFSEFTWQSRYYDRIVRDEKSLDQIRAYIYNNPTRWARDRNNPEFDERKP